MTTSTRRRFQKLNFACALPVQGSRIRIDTLFPHGLLSVHQETASTQEQDNAAREEEQPTPPQNDSSTSDIYYGNYDSKDEGYVDGDECDRSRWYDLLPHGFPPVHRETASTQEQDNAAREEEQPTPPQNDSSTSDIYYGNYDSKDEGYVDGDEYDRSRWYNRR